MTTSSIRKKLLFLLASTCFTDRSFTNGFSSQSAYLVSNSKLFVGPKKVIINSTPISINNKKNNFNNLIISKSNRFINNRYKHNDIGDSKLSASATNSDDENNNNNDSVAVSSILKPVASTSVIVIADVLLRKLFKKASISFPSSLSGCLGLFAMLLVTSAVKPKVADDINAYLKPGVNFLVKWLPVMFVPSLVLLPTAPSFGSALELAKVAVVIVGGFYFSLLTTSWSVLGVRKIFNGEESSLSSSDNEKKGEDNVSTPTAPAPKIFSDETFNILRGGTLASAAMIFVSEVTTGSSTTTNCMKALSKSLFMFFSTLSAYVQGTRFPAKFRKVVHPLVTCTTLTWVAIQLLATFTKTSFLSTLSLYKTGQVFPLFTKGGAGDALLFMLGPAVIALASQMYERRLLMRQNIKEVGTSVAVSSSFGLFGTALFVRLLQISNPTLRLSLLSRNITSPLAMAIAGMLPNADASLAVSMVVISGLIGANFGASILSSFGIEDPVARGMGVGAAAHGLGTAALSNEKDAFPFSAIAMALTASCSTILVSIPFIRKLLVSLALGA
eukprot:CAMPEP_0178964106 /NCGR_PEP_ID=MMETSP0789-20121207/15451_1 /TAXON_ID=3005 /ORGANISM="Rhizosolenia setigera, Strain CCMP 1694" /LENGTH=557 /DNA_ID=CAMNT_0020648761 /DNA_START=23 /DNA_END=1696 /DNA_ORIENTATION=-